MPSQLELYNGALRICRERRLSSLTENREPRRLLDAAWGDGLTQGPVKLCLEQGQWTWATRTMMVDYSPSVEPPFGHRYAFDQPIDLIRTEGVYADEYCTQPLLQYATERRYWYASIEPIFVSYVSNHTSYGGDSSLWSETFVQMVQAALAMEIAGNLTQNDAAVAEAEKAWARMMRLAKANDAMEKPTKFAPPGTWELARHGRWQRGYRNR